MIIYYLKIYYLRFIYYLAICSFHTNDHKSVLINNHELFMINLLI